MGPIVSFNLKRSDGTWYGYREVEKLASLAGIQLRVRVLRPYFLEAKYVFHEYFLKSFDGHIGYVTTFSAARKSFQSSFDV